MLLAATEMIAAEASDREAARRFRARRTSFVNLMSEAGVPVEEIAHLVRHTSTRTTEVVYLYAS